MNIEPILGKKIKQYRKLHAMTQGELAAVIGVEPEHIANIERGRKGISLDKLLLICRCFRISLSDILPLGEQDDSELRIKWKNEILAVIDTLETAQLEVVRTMVSSLSSE